MQLETSIICIFLLFHKIFCTFSLFNIESRDRRTHTHPSARECCRCRGCGNSKYIVIQSSVSVASICALRGKRRHLHLHTKVCNICVFFLFLFSSIDNVSSLPIQSALIHARAFNANKCKIYGIKYDEDNSSVVLQFLSLIPLVNSVFCWKSEHAHHGDHVWSQQKCELLHAFP